MELRVLKYLLIVAREENITKAAELLHISQPTLSRQLMQLEEELGVKLFQRGKHHVYLTSEGTLFRRRAQEIVDLAERAREEMSQDDEVLTGTVTIGCGEFRSMNELSQIMTAFSERYPFVKFELHSAYAADIKAMMEQGLLDIGLLIEPVEIAKYNFVRMRTREAWGVLVREDDPLAAKEAVHPEDLAGITRMLPKNLPVRDELLNWLGDPARDMNAPVFFNLQYNAAILARHRGGAVLCLNLDAHYNGMRFIPLAPSVAFHTVLVWKEHQSYSKATQAFIRFLKEYKSI